MGYECKIMADSVSAAGDRLTTFRVRFPRFILAEVNTHRVISRNSASSRAIPVEKRIADVLEDTFVPAAFAKNQRGMQAGDALDEQDDVTAREIWKTAVQDAVQHARSLAAAGVHKQWSNRFVELFAWHEALLSGTEWANYFALRDHKDASPEFQTLAKLMREQFEASTPILLDYDEWHLPYVDADTRVAVLNELPSIDSSHEGLWDHNLSLAKVSAGRCARISYETFDTKKRDVVADTGVTRKLYTSGHMSPLEHPARPMTADERVIYRRYKPVVDVRGRTTGYEIDGSFCGNYRGFVQLRKHLPGEDVFGSAALGEVVVG